MEQMAEWYGLKAGHTDFSIENAGDAAVFFARAQLDAQLQSILRRSFRTGNPPKFVLYGDWGVGKTHTLGHTDYVVRTTASYKAHVVLLELPDITARDTFQIAHAGLLDALGLERVKN